jgi:hypothetical protein
VKKLLQLLMILAVSIAGWCQASPKAKPVNPLLEYVGGWTSEFEGKAWLDLRLELRAEQLAGSLIRPQKVEINDNGGIKSVSEEQYTETVAEAVVNPDGLLLTLQRADSQDRDRYQMRLIAPEKQTADLKMLGMAMPPGMPKPMPWRLVKSGSTARKPVDAPQ